MKKCYILLLFGMILSASVQATEKLPWVAIGTFVNKSTLSENYYTGLVDRITDAIVNTRKFQVIDNARLKELIEERQAKIASGMAGDQQPGSNIAIAGFLIYGTVMNVQFDKKETQNRYFAKSEVTCDIELNLRFSDVETGKILASKTVRGKYTESRSVNNAVSLKTNFEQAAFDGAMQKVCRNACNALLELAYPAKIIAVNGSEIYVNLTPELAAKGDVFDIFETGEELRDPDTGLTLGKREILLGRITISELKPKYAIAKLQSGELAKLRSGLLLRKSEGSPKDEPPKVAPNSPPPRRSLEDRF